MKLITYLKDEREQLAVLIRDTVYDMEVLHPDLPSTMNLFLTYWEDSLPMAQAGALLIEEGTRSSNRGIPVNTIQQLAPIPFPSSYRNGHAFPQHAGASATNHKAGLIGVWDQFPTFSFANHHSIQGPGTVRCMPDHFEQLDFELQVAIVIAKHGRNIKASEADEYIAGLMILNDISARTLQLDEMKLNGGFSKGKDFATATGPWLVTLDELAAYEIAAKENHTGKNWNLPMKCSVNGQQLVMGNVSDMKWTFAELIERASYGADLYPGDIITSGAVRTGSLWELNEMGKLRDPSYPEQWLQAGDLVEMEIEGLGTLNNTMIAEETDWSILNQKKYSN